MLQVRKDVKVDIGVTGDSGAGKSSFINAIRGLDDDVDGAAPVDVIESTKEPTSYNHPNNSKVKFWDLPGIGTPMYPDLETYRERVQLRKYHTFLIFSSSRFTENDIILAKEIKKQGKSFFFIRTKIDDNVRAEKRKKSFSEAAMLQKIRRNCMKNLVDEAGKLMCSEDHIFLISNHHPGKWDFSRLTKAILDALPRYRRETLNLSQRSGREDPDITKRMWREIRLNEERLFTLSRYLKRESHTLSQISRWEDPADVTERMWLESWWKAEVHMGVTGRSGIGKWTFINAIRGVCDDDYDAAPVDIFQRAKELKSYDYPTDSSIKFWELSGIGAPYCSDLDTYRQKYGWIDMIRSLFF